VEDRIDAYVLTAVGRYGSGEPGAYFGFPPWPAPNVLARYQREIAPVYPVNYVGHNRGAALLFQASKSDQWVYTGNIQALFEAAGEPKMLRWYPSGHMLGCNMFAVTACPNADIPNYVFHRAWLAKNV
jgi:hypothetical protein